MLHKLILSVDKTINIAAFTSISFILLNDLWWFNLPELFAGGDRLLNAAYNLATGYAVSYIFYLMVVRYKEYKDECYINALVIPLLKRLIEDHNVISHCIFEATSERVSSCWDKERFSTVFGKINHSDIIPKKSYTLFYPDFEWVCFLEFQKSSTCRNIQNILTIDSHLEPELMKLLNDLDNNSYFNYLSMANRLAKSSRQCGMHTLGSSFYEYSELIDKLKGYVSSRETL